METYNKHVKCGLNSQPFGENVRKSQGGFFLTHTVEMETKMMLSELLKLLLLVLFAINVPSCWSLCYISSARKQAHAATCQKLELPSNFAEGVAKRAADQAGVVFEKVLEAYEVCSLGTRTATRSCWTRERAMISLSPIYCDNVDMLAHH